MSIMPRMSWFAGMGPFTHAALDLGRTAHDNGVDARRERCDAEFLRRIGF
jgi:hypothetical protein